METPIITDPEKVLCRGIGWQGEKGILLNSEGIFLIDYLERGSTITGQYYADLIPKLRNAIKEKKKGKLRRGVQFHHDNTPAHRPAVAMAAIQQAGLQLVKKINNGLCVQQNQCTHSCNVIKCLKWDISQFYKVQSDTECRYAVLVLNRKIFQNEQFLKRFWNRATVRVTVDGGTVHWENFLQSLPENDRMSIPMPHLVTGDFDSITPEVLERYKKQGCQIIHTPDQDYTDFTKALMEINSFCAKNHIEIDHIIALAQTSGRIDQILGNIQTLHLVKEKQIVDPNIRVYIMSDNSISWLLYPGDHVIEIPEEIRNYNRAWCALIPVGEPCQNVITTGLKWNLDNQQLKFGELVSSSNTFDGSEQVKVKCSHTLLWAMKVPALNST